MLQTMAKCNVYASPDNRIQTGLYSSGCNCRELKACWATISVQAQLCDAHNSAQCVSSTAELNVGLTKK